MRVYIVGVEYAELGIIREEEDYYENLSSGTKPDS
jgi:hypothetical protein